MMWQPPHEYPKDDAEAAYFTGLRRTILGLFDALEHPVDCGVENSCPDCLILAALNGGPKPNWLRAMLDGEGPEMGNEDRPLGAIFAALVDAYDHGWTAKLSPGEARKVVSAYLHKEQTTALLHIMDDDTIARFTPDDDEDIV